MQIYFVIFQIYCRKKGFPSNSTVKYNLALWTKHKKFCFYIEIRNEVIFCDEPAWLAIDTDPTAQSYWAEVVDVNTGYRIALGNPIWSEK